MAQFLVYHLFVVGLVFQVRVSHDFTQLLVYFERIDALEYIHWGLISLSRGVLVELLNLGGSGPGLEVLVNE